MTATTTVAHWTEALRLRGFDLVQCFDAASYNRSPSAQGTPFRLPDFGLQRPLGLVVGHGVALWESLRAAVRNDERLRCSAHPLDEYTERIVLELQRATPQASAAFFSHQSEPRVPIQRIAEVAGLAAISPSHLSVHPRLGPWLGLRIVVVIAEQYEPCSGASLERPCEGCSQPCLAPFQHAVTALDASWTDWLAVRDSCPIGRQARYSEPQIRYHYTKDLRVLRPPLPPTHRKVGEGP